MKFQWLLCLLLGVAVNNCEAQNAVGTWSNLGPIQFPINVSGQINGIGRVCQMKFDPVNSQTMYAVSSSGGLFVSHNNGQTWAPTPGTEQLPTTQCSSVCIDYTNNNVLYLSTGDPDYYYEDYGIWKSTNGGNTWTQSNNNIGNRMAVEILMDPTNHNTLVAATDDGIWKTTNGGSSWTEVVNGGNFKDMKQQPGSNTVLFAVSNSSYYRSTDFGSTWTQITAGLNVPSNNDGLRLAVNASNPNVVYIGTTGGNGIIMKSTNGGLSFSTVYNSSTQCLVCYDDNPSSGSQGNYNFSMTTNPQNPNEVLVVAHCVWTSSDGGVNWTRRTDWYAGLHTDMHDVKFNPYNNQQIFNANDGGVWLSTDPNASIWSPRSDGLAATEAYHMAQNPVQRQMVDLGAQDNGENHFDGIWKCNGGGDLGSHLMFDYSNVAMIYHMDAGIRKTLSPLAGDQNINQPFTINGNPALEFIPSLHNVGFYGQDTLYRSLDLSNSTPSWSSIGIMSSSIMSIASCRADSGILYVVTNDNHIYRSDNALSGSPSFTMLNTPAFTNITASVATDQTNAGIVYLACGGSVYRSANKGVSWTNITGNLPNLNIIKLIHDDHSTNGRLFVAAGNAVYYKDNTTNNWTMIQGMPSVTQITDMGIYNDGTAASILRLSTYGRGIWECSINNNLPPIISFTGDKRFICPGDTVHFSKTIYGGVSSFTWHFPGGMPATSTADSPVVVYPANGTYNVWLSTTGTAGNDSLLQVGYISVSNGLTGTLQEGFEGNIYPPVGWSLQSGSGINWQHIDTVGGFSQSSKSIMFDNYNNDTHGVHDRIITPEIDLTGATNARLTFNVAYSYYTGYRDSLMVLVSTDCGKTFTPIYEKDSTALASSPGTTDFFTPGPTDWRNEPILLNSYVGSSIKLAFDNIGHYGQPIYLDDINIEVTLDAAHMQASSEQLQVYPNPTTGKVFIQATALQGKAATINCYNIVGALVSTQNVSLDNGRVNTSINMASLPRGVYEIKLQTDGGSQYIRKVVLQ